MSQANSSKNPGPSRIFNLLAPFIGLALVLGIFASHPVLREFFFTGHNLKLVLTQSVIVAIGALGMTLIIISGGIDLSAGSAIALTGVIAATLLLKGMHPLIVIPLTVLAGALTGLVNGAIIARFNMVPFIVTLGMMGIARGTAKGLAHNQTVIPPDNPLNRIMEPLNPREFLPLPTGVWIAIALAVLMIIVMRRTIFGRYVFAIGSNENTARLCGIKVRVLKTLIYSLAGAFFGLAGLMQYSRLTLGDPTAAVGMELDIIAAVVIGGASLSGGSGSILGTMIGAFIMSSLRNATNQLGWETYTQEIIIGLVIILAVGIDRLRKKA